MSEEGLEQLAIAAGLIVEWEDSEGRRHRLSDAAQRDLLGRLGHPADSAVEIAASLERLRPPASPQEWPPLITAEQGASTPLPSPLSRGTRYRLVLESGEHREGTLGDDHGVLPAVDEPGYHRLQIAAAELTLAVAPPRCFTLADACAGESPRLWGLAAQLYALRRPGDGGLGDTLALEQLACHAAESGAAALAVSPVHAMFSADVNHYSPYSPSSRLHYHALHAAPEALFSEAAVAAAIERSGLGETRAQLEAQELIDWPRAARTKLTWLRALHDDVMQREDAEARRARQALATFRERGGAMLEAHCRFEALQQVRGERDWRQWPAALRDPASPGVTRFAEEHTHEVGFHAFLQWLASEGLARAQATAREAGMPIGLIADLAVGADAAGSQAWSRQTEMLEGLSIGAPPDAFNVHGQDWGLAPFSPQGLVRGGFAGFIDMLRAGFAHAGGLRIDHVLGLMRLWLVPHGASPDEGGYVRYPLDALLRLVALESWRHRAVVIGEDLGTVAPGFRERLARHGILGMRVLWFERDDDGGFLAPGQWSRHAVATSSTHDLPTLAGWWAGCDIEWRDRLGLLGENQDVDSEHAERRIERTRLARALRLVDDHVPEAPLDAAALPASKVLDACARRLGLTPAPLTLLPLEDALGLEEQANLPGTLDEHPNWRRRLPDDAERLLTSPETLCRLKALAEARREAAHGDARGGFDE
ncbi:4-alpha-glucanotransferase [Billgrantia tianxiuensis]|jgi:4-alpha-glucanotransferase|uniref:4-alpha-glucanotransferase n=1 Tax=Billgrantia tianxiuensis TaxID=2497861 RepID=A0A6I6SQX5_9GAMM|nr:MULTISPECIES: 4-alpha-glucanotransferase [Halomonas]MCE8034099.1 4-alpha-glucanotransferase [Halomonas sp. MCCC 1A11057]QHC51056.1 4-alpha-glucanotransferase [Halomonas tianxiuensis]